MLYDKIGSAITSLAKFVFGLVMFLAAITINTYTFMRLWNWFIAPLGVHALSFAWAYGVLLIAAFFTWEYATYINKKQADPNESRLEGIWLAMWKQGAACGVALLFGYIAHCWM